MQRPVLPPVEEVIAGATRVVVIEDVVDHTNVARETLTVLKRSTSAQVFRKLTWDNIHRLLRIPA